MLVTLGWKGAEVVTAVFLSLNGWGGDGDGGGGGLSVYYACACGEFVESSSERWLGMDTVD